MMDENRGKIKGDFLSYEFRVKSSELPLPRLAAVGGNPPLPMGRGLLSRLAWDVGKERVYFL